MEEPAEVRIGRGQRLLEAESQRVKAQIERKQAGRAAADALFGPKSS